MAPSDVLPILLLCGAIAFVFLRFHALAEPVKPLPTSAELANRSIEDLYKEGSDLVWPFLILADKPRRPLVTRYDHSCINRGMALLELVIERTHGNWPAVWSLGKALQAAGAPERALEQFRRAFELNPRHADIAREYIAECLVLGRGLDAVKASLSLCEMNPASAILRANLAYALVIAGEVDAARTEIDVALSAAPDDEASRNLKTLIVDIQEGRAERPTRLALPPAARSAL